MEKRGDTIGRRYFRQCKRCNEFFYADSRGGKVCNDCKLDNRGVALNNPQVEVIKGIIPIGNKRDFLKYYRFVRICLLCNNYFGTDVWQKYAGPCPKHYKWHGKRKS
ncbi:MAG: hypothetical protein ACHQ1D_01095 [Nitrososphaerales archaeon]